MTRRRGRGIASVNYPIGMNLGGDPSQALVHSNPGGKFTVALASIDLGQGMKSVVRQICAEALGVPVEDVFVDTADSDTGPHCMGSFASRGTHRVGNAVIAAAEGGARRPSGGGGGEAGDRRRRPRHRRAGQHPRARCPVTLDHGGPRRPVRRSSSRAARCRGAGSSLSRMSTPDPETGEMDPVTCYAHACMVAEVEVDDETGEVEVLSMKAAYEVGRAMNPKLVEQQLVGGGWMGMSHALWETTEPYYPDRSHGPTDFNEYLMPGPGDICEQQLRRSWNGPPRTAPTAARASARCARRLPSPPSPTRSSTRSECASTRCRSRRRKSCAR